MKIEISLSPTSFRKAAEKIREYREDLDDKCEELAERLANEGVEIAKANVVDLDAVFTSELLSSIHSENESSSDKAIFAVVVDSKHCAFVEFGTGIVGASSPYPYDFPDGVSWDYASGDTIGNYMINGEMKYGWFYNRDNMWYFTEGMPSRPFMGMTGEALRDRITELAEEIFDSE